MVIKNKLIFEILLHSLYYFLIDFLNHFIIIDMDD